MAPDRDHAAVAPGVRARRIIAALVGLTGIVLLVGAGRMLGGRPVFALVTAMLSFGLVPFVGEALAPHLPRWACDPPAAERSAHRALLIPQVARALDLVGWNGFVGRRRGAATTWGGLRAVERSTRGNIAAHGTGLVVHAGAALVSAATGAWGVAALVLLVAVPLHLYPVLIQRWVRLRLAPLLQRATRVSSQP